MARAPKSWTEKLQASRPPEIKPAPKAFADLREGDRMLISSPAQIDAFIRSIPPGQSLDMPGLRRALARANGADAACPLTTGIFLRIVAEAANEAYAQGAPPSGVTPVWRVIGPKAPVLKKLSFDPHWLLDQRAREGLSAG